MNPWRLIDGKRQITIASAYDIDESVRRLQAIVQTNRWRMLWKDGVFGSVRADHIKLEYNNSLVSNSFAPIFVGQFRTRDGVTILDGYFRTTIAIQTVMTIWFIGVGAIGVLTLVAAAMGQGVTAADGSPASTLIMLVPLAMLIFGIVFVRFSRWAARDHERRITDLIRSALDTNS